MSVSDGQKLKALELENSCLKRQLAETMLDDAVLKQMATKNYKRPM
jgi:putative transposase